MRECDFMRERSGAGCEGFFRGQLMFITKLHIDDVMMMMLITITARD